MRLRLSISLQAHVLPGQRPVAWSGIRSPAADTTRSPRGNPYTVPGKGKKEVTDSGVSFMSDSTASAALSNGVYTITNGQPLLRGHRSRPMCTMCTLTLVSAAPEGLEE